MFSTVLSVIGVAALLVVVVGTVLYFVNRRSAGSWWHLARTKAGQAGDYAQGIDPAAQMRQAALDAADSLKEADSALIECDKLQASLRRQIDSEKRTAAKLEGQIAKALQDGTP